MSDLTRRDQLIELHREYATALAREIARTLPRSVSHEDLVASAYEGLVLAASRFDATRGVQFRTYAYYRVRGAVFDQVRRMVADDPRVRLQINTYEALDTMTEQTLGDPHGAPIHEPAVTMAGIADAAGVAFTVAECAGFLLSEHMQTPTDPEHDTLSRESVRELESAMQRMEAREQGILRAIYFDGKSLEQAGAALGLSKSWASRLHTRALLNLRQALVPSTRST